MTHDEFCEGGFSLTILAGYEYVSNLQCLYCNRSEDTYSSDKGATAALLDCERDIVQKEFRGIRNPNCNSIEMDQIS